MVESEPEDSKLVYYINSVGDQSKQYSEIPEGHLTLDVALLSPKQAEERADLVLKMLAVSKELQERFPKPSDESKVNDWRELMQRQFAQQISPLYLEFNKKCCVRTSYAVPPGQYEAGQVLDRLPEGAVKFDDLFKHNE